MQPLSRISELLTFALDGWSGEPEFSAPISLRDMAEVFVANICAVAIIGGAMCGLAVLLSAGLRLVL